MHAIFQAEDNPLTIALVWKHVQIVHNGCLEVATGPMIFIFKTNLQCYNIHRKMLLHFEIIGYQLGSQSSFPIPMSSRSIL